ncbi:short chain dehydrogenase [Popillia japonica]|uniref:Short chain dehydrogenase n=1 Tax=Popillia japonica TaxID=7064 RepID=A0AAW1LDS9_POPJA
MYTSNSGIAGAVVLITGGLGAISLTYAKQLMSHGIKGLVLADKNIKNSKNIIMELENHGTGDVIFVRTDINIKDQLENAFEVAVKKFNQLDIFINNAAILNESQWIKMIQTNFTAAITSNYLALKKYLPKYRNSEEATIINTVCISSLIPFKSCAIYSTTKSGVLGLHKALSNPYWYKLYRCRFLALCPGLTQTPMLQQMGSKGIDLDLFDEECYDYPIQDPERCGDCLIEALKKGKNGSIWVCDDKIYEWIIPDRFEVGKSTKAK